MSTLAVMLSLLCYSDPDRFADSAALGGGGGRQFTGSRVDGYSCAVCHRGGAQPRIELVGLPERVRAGVRHDVEIRWLDTQDSHALQLELVDWLGRSPLVELPDPDTLPVSARCDGDPQGIPAVYVGDVGQRRVVGVQDCGATELRFSFTPEHDGELIFAASVVRSNSSGTPDGDGVLEVRQRILGEGSQPSGCSLVERSRGAAGSLWLIALLGLIRRHSNRTRSISVEARTLTRSSPTNAR